jgi:hypothetical protein
MGVEDGIKLAWGRGFLTEKHENMKNRILVSRFRGSPISKMHSN